MAEGRLTVIEIEFMAFRLAREMLRFKEPIPDFSTRFPNILESCIAAPFQSFDGKYLYPTIISRASALFYYMIKNHPFENGNKRIAMTTLLYFLHKNKKWIKVKIKDFYDFAMFITESPHEEMDNAVKLIEEFLRAHIVDR